MEISHERHIVHVTPDQTQAQRVSGSPRRAGVLSRGLVPRLRRSNGALQRSSSEFHRLGAELLGISVDGVWCHKAFAEHRNLHFPLLSDFEPKGAVAKRYGAYRDGEGVCERALFVIDKAGIISWSYCSPIAVNPGANGILEALENLQE
jgi:peroxiredoxin